MPYCHECGTKLPSDKGARFCPNCGTPIPDLKASISVGSIPTYRRGISLRVKSIMVAIIICLTLTSLGAVLPIDQSEAQELFEEVKSFEKITPSFIPVTIFGNNLMYCLAIFTPFVGPLFGAYVLFSTGKALAAVASVQGANPVTLLMLTFILPHAWIEYFSYALAMSESFYLALRIMKRQFKGELPNLFKAISACTLLLLSAAFIESLLISFLG